MSTRAIQFSGKTRFVQKQTKERKKSENKQNNTNVLFTLHSKDISKHEN